MNAQFVQTLTKTQAFRKVPHVDRSNKAKKGFIWVLEPSAVGVGGRQRREARRIRDAEAKAEAKKAVKLASNRHDQCHCYDVLGDSEENAVHEEAGTVCHTHTDGTASFHLPNCLTRRSVTTRKIYPRKKTNSSRRDPPKSVAHIFSEGEEEGEEARLASPSAKLYDPTTIASDILRAIGKHPYLPPLNAHMEGILQR